MISDFLESWEIFGTQYTTGLILAALLAMVGVLVVAEDRVFLGAAVAQASALGIAVALLVGGRIGEALAPLVEAEKAEHFAVDLFAVVFAVVASLATARPRRPGRDSREAMTAWVFLFTSSLSILLLSQSPHGMERLDELLTSTIIGATTTDVWLFGTAAIVSVCVLLASHRKLVLMVMDEETSAALGVRVGWWRVGVSVWLGATLGLAMHAGGLLFTFGCLVLPGMIAQNLCRRVAPMFFVAPLVAVCAALTGFVVANAMDYPPGQAVVALLAVLLVPAWLVRRFRAG